MGEICPNPRYNYKGVYYRAQKFYHLLSDDGFEVSACHHVNDDCLYVSYKKSNKNQTPALNTNVIVSYVTTHASLELYSYLELKDRALYCDTDSVIYRHIVRELSRICGWDDRRVGR